MPCPRAGALVVADLDFAAGARAAVVDGAGHRARRAAAEGGAARAGRVGAGHAGQVRRQLFAQALGQLQGFGPVEGDAKANAAGAAVEAGIR